MQLPEWLLIMRLFFTFLLTAGLGIHAFYQHKHEASEVVSPRKWMYWLYSAIFLVVCAVNFTHLCVTLAFHNYEKTSFHIGYSTLLLTLSYTAILIGVRRKIS